LVTMEKLKIIEELRIQDGALERIWLTSNGSGNSSVDWEQLGWRDWYTHKLAAAGDPRVDGWMFMESPVSTVALCSSYLLFVLVIGPALMRNREAMSLKYPMLVYNLAQTLFNGWMFVNALRVWFSGEYNWVCQPVDYSDSPMAILALRMSWWFYFSKFTDFFDTLFFILRKKHNQVTVLHVVHHSTMPMSSWFGPRFAGGGNTSFGGMWNLMVHVVMYSYYFLAALGVRKEYLWWKRYLTSLQMVQFIAVIIHTSIPLLRTDCNYPKEMCYIMMGNGVLYLILFYNFYRSTYTTKPAKKTE